MYQDPACIFLSAHEWNLATSLLSGINTLSVSASVWPPPSALPDCPLALVGNPGDRPSLFTPFEVWHSEIHYNSWLFCQASSLSTNLTRAPRGPISTPNPLSALFLFSEHTISHEVSNTPFVRSFFVLTAGSVRSAPRARRAYCSCPCCR